VATQFNIADTVRIDGFNVNYKQALTLLPAWARGLRVFANGNIQRATGTATSNFKYSPRFGNWGLSFIRGKYDLRVNWNYRGRQRGAAVNGRSIGPGTFNWDPVRVYMDVSAEYTVGRKFALFAKLRNVRNQTEDSEVSGPATPAYATFLDREDFAALWTFGIKGSF
jgi:hypothetical protein